MNTDALAVAFDAAVDYDDYITDERVAASRERLYAK